jgi:hypothetical protein
MQPHQQQRQRRFQDLPSDIIQEEILAKRQTLHTLVTCQAITSDFEDALTWWCLQRITALVNGDVPAFPLSLLRTVSRLIPRFETEWETPLLGDVFQMPDQLDFDSDIPFPCPDWVVTPDGAIMPNPEPQPRNHFARFCQPGHCYVESTSAADSLRDTKSIVIFMVMDLPDSSTDNPDSKYWVSMRFDREEAASIGKVQIGLYPLGDHFPEFCGAILFLFFEEESPLQDVPPMLSGAQLCVTLSQQGNAYQHIAHLPLREREDLAALLWALPVAVPLSTMINPWDSHEYTLESILFDDDAAQRYSHMSDSSDDSS